MTPNGDKTRLTPSGVSSAATTPCPKCAGAPGEVQATCPTCSGYGRIAATPSRRIRNKAELKVVFKEWAEQHGYIWFEGDLTLAAALVSYLGIEGFKIDGVAVVGGEDGD